jgi:hypothetical protein
VAESEIPANVVSVEVVQVATRDGFEETEEPEQPVDALDGLEEE